MLRSFEDQPLGIYVLYPPNRHLATKVRVFVDFLVQRFQGEPMLGPRLVDPVIPSNLAGMNCEISDYHINRTGPFEYQWRHWGASLEILT